MGLLCYVCLKACLIKLLLCNWILYIRKSISEVAEPFNVLGNCTEVFWMPRITFRIYFFPNWEHFGCLPLDGYTESSFAGSRGRQPLTSASNLICISSIFFSCSVSDYVMQLSFPSPKLLFSGGWRKSLPWRNKPNKMIHLILVLFSGTLYAKAVLKLYIPTSR